LGNEKFFPDLGPFFGKDFPKELFWANKGLNFLTGETFYFGGKKKPVFPFKGENWGKAFSPFKGPLW